MTDQRKTLALGAAGGEGLEMSSEVHSSSTRPPRPEPLPVNVEAIPGALKDRPQWVCWQWVWNGKKWDKPPFRADGNGKASSTNPATWATFAQAEDAFRARGYDGIGFVLTKDDPFTMVDLDKCLGESWAVDMIDTLDSYTEGTPSGNGYHAIIEATKPEGMGSSSSAFHDGRVEVYSAGRYMTVTGHHVAGTPDSIEPRQEALESACGPLLKHKPQVVASGNFDMLAPSAGFYGPAAPERIREVLSHVPNSGEGCPYEDGNGPSYIGVMMAVHDETTGGGFDLFREWSAQSSKHNPAEDRRKWDSLTPGRGVGFGSVVKWAQDYGALPKKRATEGAASFDELLTKAKELDSTADPAAINTVAESAATLDKIGQGMVVKAIAKATGLSVVDIRAAVKAAARRHKPTTNTDKGGHQPMPPEMFPDIIWGEGGACKVLQTIPNVAAMLDYYGIHVTYDVIAKKVKVTVPGSSGAPDNVDNSALSTVISLAKLNEIPVDQVPAFVAVIADERQENPIADWITSKEWDGRDRLPELYNTLEVADGYPLAMRDLLIRRWLISAAAAALKPRGFHTRGVLTLQGEQSIGKSQWLRSLIDDEQLRERLIKIDHLLDPANKDSVLGAITHWLVELGELDGSFRKADIARIKGFITADMDRVRRPYDKLESEYQRRTVFFASVNDAQFLVDDTGNSRFWTIAAESVNYEHGINMQQLWAQVAELWRSGEQWWLTKEEEARLEEINRGHRVASSIRELLDTKLAWDTAPTVWKKKTASEVLISIGYDKPTNPQAREAGAVLRERGCTENKTRGVTKFLVPDLASAWFLDGSG